MCEKGQDCIPGKCAMFSFEETESSHGRQNDLENYAFCGIFLIIVRSFTHISHSTFRSASTHGLKITYHPDLTLFTGASSDGDISAAVIKMETRVH